MKQLTEGVHTAAYRKILIPLFLLLFPLITTAQTSVPEEVSNADKIAELSTGLNTVWMLLAAMLVFFMQPGFALVEAGFTRSKNTAPFKLGGLDWSAEIGATPWETSFYNNGASGFEVSNICLGASKEIKITDSYSLPVFAQAIWNPATEGAYFVFGISF